jgi:choline-sulfatase
VPLIMAGPGIGRGEAVATPVSLVDFFTTILDALDGPLDPADWDLPGRSLFEVRDAPLDRERRVFGEYHAAGAISGAFMLRQGDWKYVHYAGYPPQLFNLVTDPDEIRDLAADPQHHDVRQHFEQALREILDPDAVDAKATAAQAAIVDQYGGREAVIARGSFGATPAPGQRADLG